jgi:hypothetical protein
MRNLLLIGFVTVMSGISGLGQSAFNGLTPGKSTRANVENLMGPPVRQLSETLSEYKSSQRTEQVFVQYVPDSDEIARIELTYAYAIKRSAALGSANLPARSTGWQINSKNRLEEYFSPAFVVLTYMGADVSTGVTRIGYYSRQLFENSFAKLPPGSSKQSPPGLNSARAAANNPDRGQPVQPTAGNYGALIAQANSKLQASDFETVVSLSQQAIALDPNRPGAYEVMGIAQLYGLKDVTAASSAMRAARERGGTAAFTVTHDHDGSFQTYCQGQLNIVNFGVSYRSYDGTHSFLVSHDDIKEAGLNKLVGSNLHAFHIKINQAGKTMTYNFAPGTLTAGESTLILQLLKNP